MNVQKENKFLKVMAHVVLAPTIELVIAKLDGHFEKAGLTANVTSGYRDSDDQLRVIRQYLVKKGLDKKYLEAMVGKAADKLPNGQYIWQMAWSNLLNVNIIINPPIKAVLLMDYYNSKGINRKGDSFNMTPHATAKCFDIGGGADGLNNEIAVVEAAKKDIPEIKGWVIERNNNCLHIDCY